MTTGERMVWAAEFVRAMADGQVANDAALSSSSAVWVLQDLAGRLAAGDGAADHRAMLDDMLSTGGDR